MTTAATRMNGEQGEVCSPLFGAFAVPTELGRSGSEPGGVGDQANPFVFLGPLVYLLADVLPDIGRDSIHCAPDREQLYTAEPVGGESPVVHLPEGTQQRVSGAQPAALALAVVGEPSAVFVPIKPGADVALALHNQVVVPGTPFLSFPGPNPLTVKGAEVPAVHVVKPAAGLFVVGDVIGKGEREKTAVFYTVEEQNRRTFSPRAKADFW